MPDGRRFSRAVKRAAFERAGGTCDACGSPLPVGGGGIEYDHIDPWAISRDSSLENCAVVCARCHHEKSAQRDIPTIAKLVRLADRAIGIKKPSKKMPGGRDSGISITMSRGVVRRQSGAEKHAEFLRKRYGDFDGR